MSCDSCTGAVSFRHPLLYDGTLPNHPSEERAYYGHPSYHQSEAEKSSHLSFLYDRPGSAQLQPVSSIPCVSSVNGARENSSLSSGSTERRSSDRNGVPVGVPSFNEYQPAVNRAIAAPLYQHRTITSDNNTSPTVHQTVEARSQGVHQNQNYSDIHHTETSARSPCIARSIGLTSKYLPSSPEEATGSVNGSSVAPRSTRNLSKIFARRQSAPGPCLPPSSTSSRAVAGKKQWSITPCGFTNTRGQPYTPVTSSDHQEEPGSAFISKPKPGSNAFTSSQFKTSNGFQESVWGKDHTLQKPEADSLIDRSSIRQNLRAGDEPGEYDETSIRYTGKANPSKLFRLLQTATGSDTESDIKHARSARRRPSKEIQHTEVHDQSNPDDIIDIAYVGSNIPSKTFRCLQEAIGTRTPHGFDENQGMNQRSVRVIHLRPSIMRKHSSMDNILDELKI